jgi:hypothetical protein
MTIPAPTATAPAAPKQKSPVGLAALIVGAVAFVFAIVPVLSFIAWLPAIAAIVLGIIGLVQKNRARGFAWAGLALGIVSWIVAIAVSVATFAGAASSISESIESAAPSAIAATPEPVAIESTPPAADTPVAEATVAEPAPVATPAAPELTLSQRNAVSKGKSYLEYSAFSRSGLIDQLEYEGYSTADAEFAVDNIAPDWNAQAAAKAKSYLDYSSFSRDGLIDQLLYEGFSQEQAEAGASAVGY